MNAAVVDLQTCRDLLEAWETVRSQIVKGEIHALAVCAKNRSGEETVIFAGDYKDEPDAALSAAMRLSWELTKDKT
jgi:hypothetical protein